MIPEVANRHTPRPLSAEHRRMLEEGSGISPDVIAERGYFTARRRSEVPAVFKDYQRRTGLVIPTHSPDGETGSFQLKPNNPRMDKKGKVLRYETPGGSVAILDVHPRMREEVRAGDGDLWVTEGVKKVDALTSRGLPTVGLVGVWMATIPKQRPYRLRPCWDHVRLHKRRVFVVFDSDVMCKPEVQHALRVLVALLEKAGAEVLVVYLEDAKDGSKVGVDDYVAAGQSVAELKMRAREFDPADIGSIRVARNPQLRAAIDEVRTAWWGTDWNRLKGTGEEPHWMRGHTARDVEEAMLKLAVRSGKVTSEGVRLTAGLRTISEEAAKGKPATGKAIKHLQAEGRLFIHEPEDRRQARSYTLVAGRAPRYHNGGEAGASEGQATQRLEACDLRGNGLRAPDVDRLRWSAPAQKKRLIRRKEMVAGRVRTVTEVVGRDAPRIERLGPHRGAVVDYLEACGGTANVAEICQVLHKSRPRDVRRRLLATLGDAGIIATEGDVVSLTDGWRERLEEKRYEGGEVEAEKRQKDRHEEERRQYRENGPPPPAEEPPALMGPERVAKIVAQREKEAMASNLEEQRRKVGTTADTFAYDKLRVLGRIRLELLREIYQDAGGDPRDMLLAALRIGCSVERLPEYGNRQFVFAPPEWSRRGAA